MTIVACIIADSPVVLWGLSSRERLQRQLESIGIAVASSPQEFEAAERVLLVRADFLFEARTLKCLTEVSDALLCTERGSAAALVIASQRALEGEQALLQGKASSLAGVRLITPADLNAFDVNPRRSEPPLLEELGEARRSALEDLLYGNAYKGITDLVTKWLWPRPAKRVVRWCARNRVTPNLVTGAGFALVIVATLLFYEGAYWSGLAAAWLMTLLDTVDGKLARVTVQSSRFGHYFDHGIDLLHPPFWYIAWGLSRENMALGQLATENELYWLILLGYIGGRLVEGAFHLFANCSIFTWRPFDAWFRLVTARRNPCLIIMTLTLLVGLADWSIIGVALWTGLTTLVLVLRLLQGFALSLRRGRLNSWLAEPDAVAAHPRSFRTFSATAGAYAPG